ncbi:IS3 family transposase [Lactococcus sp. dk322]|nr:IS3 family transposase [Lactococcus sp. dk101]TXK36685.1 IS3 family transposase [Lactococcus sp. dk310]TXK46475.1 IS3 family transposase [Lactococcus sp. dk322]
MITQSWKTSLVYSKKKSIMAQFFNSFEDLSQATTIWIEYYNTKRIKKKLNWMRPIQHRLTYSK